MECIELNWLCKHIKKIGSSQPAILVQNWVKHQSFPVSIVKTGDFPDPLKFAEIPSIHKKDDPFGKDNYRPIRISPLISKVFEKIIYSQVYNYIQQYLNPLLCKFRQGHGTQHALFLLLQAWQKELNESGYTGTVLTNLSKAYDCLPHG